MEKLQKWLDDFLAWVFPSEDKLGREESLYEN